MGSLLKLAGTSQRFAEMLLGYIEDQREELRVMLLRNAKAIKSFVDAMTPHFDRYHTATLAQLGWPLIRKLLRLHFDSNLDMNKLKLLAFVHWNSFAETCRHHNHAHAQFIVQC